MLYAFTHAYIIIIYIEMGHACHMHVLYILHKDASLHTCKTNLLYYIIFNNVYGIVGYFPEFYKWALLLGKIYSRLLHEV